MPGRFIQNPKGLFGEKLQINSIANVLWSLKGHLEHTMTSRIWNDDTLFLALCSHKQKSIAKDCVKIFQHFILLLNTNSAISKMAQSTLKHFPQETENFDQIKLSCKINPCFSHKPPSAYANAHGQGPLSPWLHWLLRTKSSNNSI